MAVKEFRDNESGYQKWLTDNPQGYVLTTISEISPDYMSLHRSTCRMISHYMKNMAKDAFTGRDYMKVCSQSTSELLEWIKAHGGNGFTKLCSKCAPDSEASMVNKGYIDPRYTFDNFVVAPNNQSCVSAARRVVEQPGKAHNPLCIYGGEGLGKTHLMHAIANALMAKDSLITNCQISIVCQSTEQFATGLIAAVRDGETQAFRGQYQQADVLMIDDVQLIAGKPSTQKELFSAFDALYERKKQILLTSSVPPDDFNTLNANMNSRYTSSMVTEMKCPNLETRLLILAKKAEAAGVALDDDVAHLLASRFTTNIRELEGALTRLAAYAMLTEKTINLDLAKYVLMDILLKKPC